MNHVFYINLSNKSANSTTNFLTFSSFLSLWPATPESDEHDDVDIFAPVRPALPHARVHRRRCGATQPGAHEAKGWQWSVAYCSDHPIFRPVRPVRERVPDFEKKKIDRHCAAAGIAGR